LSGQLLARTRVPLLCETGDLMRDDAGRLARARSETVALITDLEKDLTAIDQSTADAPDDEHDPEGSTIGFERARVGALLHQAEQRLAGIDAARERSRRGTYERCERCGGPISPERLDALPSTSLCIGCAGLEGGLNR
jgi:DnaK suppressor protein